MGNSSNNSSNSQLNMFEATTKNSINSQEKQVVSDKFAPLAHRSRPESFEGYFGQSKVVNTLKSKVKTKINHLIFWGPPGCGKTTVAKILAKQLDMELYSFNAVMSGVKELRELIKSAKEMELHTGKKAIIFIDEIHRFNKGQQDALLPYLESNEFILFGATTEYPQTSLNRAIISRVELVELQKLDVQDLTSIVSNAAKMDEIGTPDNLVKLIAEHSNGDARIALNHLEFLNSRHADLNNLSLETVLEELLGSSRHYDKNSNRHYDVISAFIKSIRGSDPDAALLWLAVMLDGGEEPEFIARRLMIAASEDIGNANPDALQMANSAHYAVKNIGMPEARIILAQATTYLASSPKSNASYKAVDAALDHVRSQSTIEVPGHLQNHSPEKKNYKYPHAYPGHFTIQNYTQDKDKVKFYSPTDIGFESKFKNYLERLWESGDYK